MTKDEIEKIVNDAIRKHRKSTIIAPRNEKIAPIIQMLNDYITGKLDAILAVGCTKDGGKYHMTECNGAREALMLLGSVDTARHLILDQMRHNK